MRFPSVTADRANALLAPDQTSCALVLLTTSRQAINIPTGATHVFLNNTANMAAAFSATPGSSAANLTTGSSGCNVVYPPGERCLWIGKGSTGEITMLAPTAGGYASLDFRGST